ncbi:MAG: flagellar motor protein MotB [Planctomycetota bacterium]
MKAPPEPVIVKVVDEIVKKKGAPGYMVSFGDMMTLILCFFILLVSMAKERSFGMMAKGIGSFVVQLKSHGLTGIMDGAEKEEIFDQVRRRFNLPPESDPERRAPHDEASNHEMLRAQTLELLEPHRETGMPRVAAFEQGSARLTDATRHYLDQLVPSLFPRRGQLLVLEGHAMDPGTDSTKRQLALARAQAVRDYLVDNHDFPAARVEARIWLQELLQSGEHNRTVDARLITPTK